MALEASYYGLYLLRYLRETEDTRQHDHDFINSRADDAAGSFEGERRAGATVDQAQEVAMRVQKRQLMATKFQDGTTALDYVKSWSEDAQPWAMAGVLSCIEKGYSLNRLTINWEARDLRYDKK